jgi:transposase-like protein
MGISKLDDSEMAIFKKDVLKQVQYGATNRQICKKYDITHATLRKWLLKCYDCNYDEFKELHGKEANAARLKKKNERIAKNKAALVQLAAERLARRRRKEELALLPKKERARLQKEDAGIKGLQKKRENKAVASQLRLSQMAADKKAEAKVTIIENATQWQPIHDVRAALKCGFSYVKTLAEHFFDKPYNDVCIQYSGYPSRVTYKLHIINESITNGKSIESAAEAAGVDVSYVVAALKLQEKANKGAGNNISGDNHYLKKGTIAMLPAQVEDGRQIGEVLAAWGGKELEVTSVGVRAVLPENWIIAIGIFGRAVLFNQHKAKVASWDSNLEKAIRLY